MFLPPLLYFLWSLSFPVGKKLLSMSPPIFLTGARMILGAALLFGFLAIFQRSTIKKINKKGWFALCILGFFSIFLTNILEFWSLQRLSSAKTCFLYSLSPFLTAILSYFHFKEKMTWKKSLGILIGVSACIPVLMIDGAAGSLKSVFHLSLAEISMFCAVFFAVYGWILLRILVKDNQLSPPLANCISMAIGGVISIVVSLFVDSWTPFPIAAGKTALFTTTLVILTILSNLICYNLYGYLLKRYTATILSFFGLLSPIFASIHGYFILGESISPIIFVSTLIVLIGLKLVYSEETRLGYIKKKEKKPTLPSAELNSQQKA